MVDYDPQAAINEAHDLRRLLLSERDHTLRLRILLNETEEMIVEELRNTPPNLERRKKRNDRLLLLARIREELPKK
jgi:hypothetical protein